MNPRHFLRRILARVAALAVVLPLGSLVFAQTPASNLILTVQEQANGDVEFSLSGTAYMKQAGSFSSTEYDTTANHPPHTVGGSESAPLPSGLMLTPDGGMSIPLNNIYFNSPGYWFLGTFPSGPLAQDTATFRPRVKGPRRALVTVRALDAAARSVSLAGTGLKK